MERTAKLADNQKEKGCTVREGGKVAFTFLQEETPGGRAKWRAAESRNRFGPAFPFSLLPLD